MSVVGALVKGHARRVRCDGCGRISSDAHGYYWPKGAPHGGNISSHGRDCEHDFCDECESRNGRNCPKCGCGIGDESQ